MKKNLRVGLDYIKNNLEMIIVLVVFLVIFFGIKWAWSVMGLPNQDELVTKVQGFFVQYGLWVIFISALFESMLFVGWYFPGSLVIFLGVSATTGNPLLAIKTVLTVCLGMVIGYSFNYMLGKVGWYKVLVKYGFKDELVKIENKVRNGGMFDSFFLYVMPGFGSLLSTAFGVLKFSYTKFLSFTILMVLFWNTLWGVLVYYFGMNLFKILTNPYMLMAVFAVYFIYIYNKQMKLENKV